MTKRNANFQLKDIRKGIMVMLAQLSVILNVNSIFPVMFMMDLWPLT
ncbi:unnamed protein product [Onchocerca flexuosa]|uniref:MFS transporter n=1 Tax=Onchocerca flexuosa TaxID=387005 RepID=A0A183HQV8_9BILA|nr:unnamed protein product [Onchocerca flexuosa]